MAGVRANGSIVPAARRAIAASRRGRCLVFGCAGQTRAPFCSRHVGVWQESGEYRRALAVLAADGDSEVRRHRVQAAMFDFATRVSTEERNHVAEDRS